MASATLTNANLAGANLTGAYLAGATLTNADFTDAQVAQASFWDITSIGFTAAQLYSTASYKVRDLHGIGLGGDNLSAWNFAGQNLTGANFEGATLTNATLAGANLTRAVFYTEGGGVATLTNADFTDAQVAEASFEHTTSMGFTAAQLYSTASYKARDLHGINLGNNNLTGWNFANQNLTLANLYRATLTNANLAGANLTGASLALATLPNANLAGANLTGANFYGAALTNADFTDAQVAQADFRNVTSGGFTAAQLYSTASYKARDLHGINLGNNNMTGWNFANQNLTLADFYRATLTNAKLTGANFAWAGLWEATLTNANLAGANLTGANFEGASLTNADLSFADTRGVQGLDTTGVASLRNTIMYDGTIQPLALAAGETLTAYEYSGNIPITVTGSMTIDPLAKLDLTNNSMIVRADATDPKALLIQITGLLASGRKSTPSPWQGTGILSSTAAADAKQFHGLGIMLNADSQGKAIYDTFAGQSVDANAILIKYTYNGDANLDGVVNADDYFLIDSNYIPQNPGWYNGDFNYDSVINADDYFLIDSAFLGQSGPLSDSSFLPSLSPIPEPSLLLPLALSFLLPRRRRIHRFLPPFRLPPSPPNNS